MKKVDFENGNITQNILKTALPMLIAQVLNLLYSIVDRIYTVFLMISTGMNPYINAQGYAAIGMCSVMIGAVANLMLDPIFIFLCGMGVEGAAVATIISQILSFLYVLRFLKEKKNDFQIRPGLNFPYAGKIIGLGIAPFIMQFTNSLVQITCNHVLMEFGGVMYVSVMTIVSSVQSILDTPVFAVTEGTSPAISYNNGAARPANVKKSVRIMMSLALPYTFLVWLLIMLQPEMVYTNFQQ